MALGSRLVAARKEKGLTQREVAMELGVHEMRISNWERGQSLPSAVYERALAEFYFDGDLNALYGIKAAA